MLEEITIISSSHFYIFFTKFIGMARFCTEKYNKPTLSSNLYAHLTNYSLNKANESYIHSNSLYDQLKGKKIYILLFYNLLMNDKNDKRNYFLSI